MKEPVFSTIIQHVDSHIPKCSMRLNVSTIYEFQRPNKENYYIKLINTTIGYREPIENINYNYWNGCVMVDVDYKKYPDATREKSILIMKDIYLYLQQNFPNTFYYGEISANKKGGFHFIFYLDTEYPTQERRDYLYKRSNMVVWKAFCDCGYKDIIEYPDILDTCTNTYTQYTKMTLYGNVNKLCTGDFKGDKGDFTDEEIEEFNSKFVKKKYKAPKKLVNHKYTRKLISYNEPKEKIKIPHSDRRGLFYSLAQIFSGDELKQEWYKCCELLVEYDSHTLQYYKDCPYTINDWNEKMLSGDSYYNNELIKMFGYNIQSKILGSKNINNINLINDVYEKFNKITNK